MNGVRKSLFAGSWYPGTGKEVEDQIGAWDSRLEGFSGLCISGIVPHAGWYFSGQQAYDVIRRFDNTADLMVIFGGHLSAGSPFLYWSDDSCQTPCGLLTVQTELRDHLVDALEARRDDSPDNTIEVQLPIVRCLLGDIPIVPLRAPAGIECLEAVNVIKSFCDDKGLKPLVLGSTDLTHYGSNYGFYPPGSEEDPLSWVENSDGRIIEAMKNIDPPAILEEARINGSACSAGAAACAAAFAGQYGIDEGTVLSYDTSYSKHPSDSFVGYGAVVYGN